MNQLFNLHAQAAGGRHVQKLVHAIRATVLVFGISALATLFSKMVGNSGLREFLLMHQASLPGALIAVELVENLTYAVLVLLIACLVARNYWRDLFPAHIRWTVLVASLAVGILFAMFLNHPLHVFLFERYFDKPAFQGGAVSDVLASGTLRSLGQASLLFTLPALVTMFATPFIEELTDRGILFEESKGLALWQAAILSFLVFCLSHYAIGGMVKVIAVVPAALLFVGIRVASGSFLYAFAAHVGVNAAALLKLQI